MECEVVHKAFFGNKKSSRIQQGGHPCHSATGRQDGPGRFCLDGRKGGPFFTGLLVGLSEIEGNQSASSIVDIKIVNDDGKF
jgi:hypothetical protein